MSGGYLLDVRTPKEFERGHIEVDIVRDSLDEIPKDVPIYITCQVGHRGYLAVRILQENGFENVINLSGGYGIYSIAKR